MTYNNLLQSLLYYFLIKNIYSLCNISLINLLTLLVWGLKYL